MSDKETRDKTAGDSAQGLDQGSRRTNHPTVIHLFSMVGRCVHSFIPIMSSSRLLQNSHLGKAPQDGGRTGPTCPDFYCCSSAADEQEEGRKDTSHRPWAGLPSP